VSGQADVPARAAACGDAAVDIAKSIASSAIWSDDMCTFVGAAIPDAPTDPPRFRTAPADIYEGTAGIARFLGHLAAITGEAPLRRTALGALRHSLATTEGWSLYTGGAGVAVVALELAELLDEASVVPNAVQLLDRVSAEACETDGPDDLLVGRAGVILALASAMQHDLDGGWEARCFHLGRSLVSAAVPEGIDGPDGVPLSWRLARESEVRLCGLAHGASGVALAFESLATLAGGDAAWRALARRARAFERMYYSVEHGSWADLREWDGHSDPPCPHMWCHGSIGIGAERLRAATDDVLARADLVCALAGVRSHATRLLASPVGPASGDAMNGSLCHGIGGLIDLCLDALGASGEEAWLTLALQLADVMRNDARRTEGWRSGIAGGHATPGLMLGSAGMGWVLARIANPTTMRAAWDFERSLGGQVGARSQPTSSG
jgi:class II lanthipeptide synthase